MKWIDTPPCGRMDLKTANESLIELEGPSAFSKALGVGVGAFGATFAGVALRFARLPAPLPFKMLSLAFGVIGGSVAAAGIGSATSKCWIRIDAKGIALRWRWGPLKERALMLAVAEIAGVEVQSRTHTTSDDYGGTHTTVSYRVVVVLKDGKAHELEDFGLSTQATLRKEQLERVLRVRS